MNIRSEKRREPNGAGLALLWRSVLICALVCLACPAIAADSTIRIFLSGNDLWNHCSKPGYNSGVCDGYIMAIADAVSGDNSVLGLRACISVEVAGSQIREIVVGALHREEASRNLAARGIVAKALAQAFPCAQ
jgi:hypothetical protein